MAEQAQHQGQSPGKPISFISSFFLLSFGYVAARFMLGLLRTRLLTEVLPKEMYGSLTLAAMTITFTATFLSLGGYEFLVRRLPGLTQAEQRGWLRLMLRRLAMPGWLLAGVVLILLKWAGAGEGLAWIDAGLLWLALGFTSWLFYRTFYFLGCGQLVRVRLIQLFQHDLWFLAIVAAGLFSILSLTVLLGVWTLWLAALTFAVIVFTGRIRSAGAVSGSIRDAVIFGMPLLPMIAGDILFRIADRYLLLAYSSMSVVAEYTLCMNIAMIAYVVGASLMDIKIPALYAERNLLPDRTIIAPSPGMKVIFSVMLRLVMGAGIAAGLALIFFSEAILRILSGPAFHSAAPLLPWTSLVPILFLISAVISRGLLTMDRTRLVGGTTLAAAACSALLSFVFIPRWGAVGAAAAISASLAVLIIVLGWELGLRKWIDRASLKPVSLIMLLIMCSAGFHAINQFLPALSPFLRLTAGGMLAAAALWISGTYGAGDFHTPIRQIEEHISSD